MCKQLEALAAKSQQEWHWSSQEPPKKSDQGNEMTRHIQTGKSQHTL